MKHSLHTSLSSATIGRMTLTDTRGGLSRSKGEAMRACLCDKTAPTAAALLKENTMYATGTIRTLLTVSVIVTMACWAASAQADENGPKHPPFWWNDSVEAERTVKAGWNFNDNDNPDEDQRPDWCNDPPYVLPGGEAEPVDMGGDHGRGLGIPLNEDGRTALVWFYVDNLYDPALVKELWIQYDLYKSGPVTTGLVIEPEVPAGKPTPKVTDHKYQRLPKDLGDGWTRYTVRKCITPQPDGEWIKFTFGTIEGEAGSVVIDNVWIGTHCSLYGDQNHSEGYNFREPHVPPNSPEPAFYCASSWYEGTQWECYGSYPPDWMPEVTDHQGVIGMPESPVPEAGEILITFDDQFNPDRSRHVFYQYDRYTAGGEVFSEEWLPPGTTIENRVEQVEELDEGWERVMVSFDVDPRPEWEAIHFMMLTTESPAGPVAIDNLIFSAGWAKVPPSFGFASKSSGPLATPPIAPLWSEKFDSYALGSSLHGQGGWKGWGNDPSVDALVTDAQAKSDPHSVDVVGGTDLVHEYADYTSGKWEYSAWQYIPSDFVGGEGELLDGSFFIMMNTYDDAGPFEESDWSVQMNFDSNDGMLKVYHGNGMNTVDVPYVPDEWVKIKAVIDLDNDLTEIYYNGAFIVEYPWTAGVTGVGGGALNIGAVDLYANGSTSIYYDNFRLKPLRP